jgi:hypothetical protein
LMRWVLCHEIIHFSSLSLPFFPFIFHLSSHLQQTLIDIYNLLMKIYVIYFNALLMWRLFSLFLFICLIICFRYCREGYSKSIYLLFILKWSGIFPFFHPLPHVWIWLDYGKFEEKFHFIAAFNFLCTF